MLWLFFYILLLFLSPKGMFIKYDKLGNFLPYYTIYHICSNVIMVYLVDAIFLNSLVDAFS